MDQALIDKMVASIITQSHLDAITKVMGMLTTLTPPPPEPEELDDLRAALEADDERAWSHAEALREHFARHTSPYFTHVEETILRRGLSFGTMMWLYEDFYAIRFILPHELYPQLLHFLEAHYPMGETSPSFLSLEQLHERVAAGQPIGPATPARARSFFT